MARIFVLGGYAESLVNFRGDLLRSMIVAGHDVYACAPEKAPETEAKLANLGVIYISIPFNRTGLNPVRDVIFIKSLVALLRDIKPDIFLGYTIKPVTYGSISARIAGVSAIYSMVTGLGYAFTTGSLRSLLVGAITRILYRTALRFNRHVLFQNPDDMNLFERMGLVRRVEQSVLINGSGVDTLKFCKEPYPRKLSFLLIARLLKDKGVHEYVNAARRVRRKYPGVCFRLAGWIDQNPNSIREEDLRKWRESGDIDYLGKLDDVRPSIADCSVYVLPSYREGTPRTVLEAMSMARPIITTDAPGCRETVRQGYNGYLVPVHDVDSLVDAMEKFIDQPDLVKKMGRVSRNIAVEKYDVQKVNAVILETMGLI